MAGHATAFVLGLVAEVGLGGCLDPVCAAAEVDRVQVGGDDLVLGPLVGELVGEGGLAELLEDRAMGLGLERVLDELLLDRGGALDAAVVADVGPQRTGDPAQVDAAVVVEALVLDRDHRLLDDRGDLGRCEDHAVLLAEDPDGVTEVVVQERALLVAVQREARQGGEVGDDRDEDAEHERHEAEQQQRHHDRDQAQALEPWPGDGPDFGLRYGWLVVDAHARQTGERDLQREDRTRSGGAGVIAGGAPSPQDRPSGPRENSIRACMRDEVDAAAGAPQRQDPHLARLAEELSAGAVDSLPEGALLERLTGAAKEERPLRVKLGDRPYGSGHPPRPRGGAAQAAPVPGLRAPGGADHRRLHRARGRPFGALEPEADALRRGDRRQRRDLPVAGDENPRRGPGAAGGEAQQRVAGDAHGGAAEADAPRHCRPAARAGGLRQADGGLGADLAAGAAVPATAGLRLGGGRGRRRAGGTDRSSTSCSGGTSSAPMEVPSRRS